MPYKTDKKKLADPFLNRRVRMLPCQKEMAKYWHEKEMPIRAIARMFRVNKRTIQFLLFPERHQKNLADRKARGGSKIYYKREYHNNAMKSHRRYKHATLSGKDNSVHLKTYLEKIKAWEMSSIKNKKMDDATKKASRDELKNWYVISNLKRATGLSSADIKKYPQLVEAMRQHMKFRRAIREKLK